MNIRLINIEQLPATADKSILRPTISDEFNYTAIAIEEDGSFYYWAKSLAIEITQDEFAQICVNPKIFYFSTALELHHRIIRAKLAQSIGLDSRSECIERVRLWANTFAEKRRDIQTGRIYYKGYGHLKGEFQGLIGQSDYERLVYTSASSRAIE